MVVDGWLRRAAAEHPRRVALETPAGSWTYEELRERAERGAVELLAAGAGSGARVAIALPADLSFAHALHSCLLLGAIAVPVDLRLAPPEREAIENGCDLVLGEPLESAAGRSAAAAPRVSRGGVRAGGVPSGHETAAPMAIIHTSGTTSRPRPVTVTYGNFLWSALGSAVALDRDPRERWLCALPLSHVGGLSILVRSAIYATTAVVHERFEADRAARALMGEDVTLVSLVATTLARLLEAGVREPPRLRCALTGGGPVSPELLRRAREAGIPVGLTYGLTESCSQATTTPVADLAAGRPDAGPPLFCTRVGIAGDGEILLRGPTIAPAAAAPDGWLHTGDLGEIREGRLHVHGRKAETIISGGENVAPAEVEGVLEEHPEVLEAAVIGRPDEQWGEAVEALVVLREDASAGEAELREHCTRSLAPYKVPKRIVLRAEPLPRTASGKLLRRELT